jgi:uncharacterized FlaG/YvyC family protein
MASVSSVSTLYSGAVGASNEVQERRVLDGRESSDSMIVVSAKRKLAGADFHGLQEALHAANQRLSASGSELELSFNSESGVVTMRVVSKQTGEVLLQVPAQNGVIDTGALLSGLGLFVNESP